MKVPAWEQVKEKALDTVSFRCDDAGKGVEVDLTWKAAVPATDEPRHILRQGETTILDAFRFVQQADVTRAKTTTRDCLTATPDRRRERRGRR